MMENGLYKFYKSNGLDKMQSEDDAVNIIPITMEQMKNPIKLFILLYQSAVVVFILEIIIFYWNTWRKSMYYLHDKKVFFIVKIQLSLHKFQK